ncbi:MAG: hypothetical protein JRE18_10520 [Deltaproteobacteria bacterium]|jgi:hypothetical protein|nr:hypothetical protein [Deltaproteobacteria bacterium]
MNKYLEILEKDIDKVVDMSRLCRGELCRSLESELDALQNELGELKIYEGDFEKELVEKMSRKLKDAYKHLEPDIDI